MGNYVESKKKLDEIRNKYNCSGDIIVRTAIQMIVEYGQSTFRDEAWFEEQINEIDDRHDLAESAGKILFMTRDFEKSLYNCSKDLASIETYDLLTYIKEEVYFGSGEIGKPDYQRAVEIIRNCLYYIGDCYGAYRENVYETLQKFREMNLTDDEIEYFGWSYSY